MAPIYDVGRTKNLVIKEEEKRLIEGAEDLYGLERGSLYPGKKYPPISFWQSLLGFWNDKQAGRGMRILLILFVELLVALGAIGIAVWKYWQHR